MKSHESFRLAEILGRMFPSILKGKEGQGSKEPGGGGGGQDERDKDLRESVIGRVGEELTKEQND